MGRHLEPGHGVARVLGMEGDMLYDALEVFSWKGEARSVEASGADMVLYSGPFAAFLLVQSLAASIAACSCIARLILMHALRKGQG